MRDKRPTFHERGYTSEWVDASTDYRTRYPYCLGCSAIGLVVESEVVDHIIPHGGDQDLMWDEGNWQPACAWHHNSIKAQLDRRYKRGELDASQLRLDSKTAIVLTRQQRRPLIGADGYPIDETVSLMYE
jgi:5-methylcytosine-specific restriction protein A